MAVEGTYPFSRGIGASDDATIRVAISSDSSVSFGDPDSFGSPFPAKGIAIGFKDNGGNLAPGNLDGSGNLKVTFGGTSSINVAQINGVTPLMGNGATGTGSQRVTIASDNSTINVALQASGSTSGTLQSAVSATGNGSTLSVAGMSSVVYTVTGTFTATVDFEGTEDGTNYTSLSTVKVGTSTIGVNTTSTGVFQAPVAGLVNVRARVTWTSGTSVTVTAHAVPVDYAPKVINANIVANTASNQSVNVAQINGVTPLMGNGVTGTGSQRVTIASDNSAISISLPANASASGSITAADVASTSTAGNNSQNLITGTPTTNSAASFAISTLETIRCQITGTFVATLVTELSSDGGTTWVAVSGHQTGTAFNTGSFTNIANVDVNVGGATNFRVRSTAYTSGTATVSIQKSVNDSIIYVTNPLRFMDGTGTSNQAAVTASNALKVDGSAVTLTIQGVAAQGASVSGNPVLQGCEARDTLGTAVSTGQAVRMTTDRYGAVHVTAVPTSHASSNGTPITATTTSVVAAPAASNHLRVTRFTFSNGGSTSTWVSLRDGASGTRHYNVYLVQGATISLDLNQSGPLDLTTATRLDIFLSAAGSVEYEVDYLTVAD